MRFELEPETAAERNLRLEVRDFLDKYLPTEKRRALGQAGGGHDPEFSRQLANRGWVGMSIPKRYGGQGSTAVQRFVVTEELLAAQAPVSAHWIADRQSGPSIALYGTPEQRELLLPPITRGESFWAIGMSEPDSGSDLASVRTRATPVEGGWSVSGQKVWTTWAHLAHYFAVLCRTSGSVEDRHVGLSQLIVDLSSPGVTIRPIRGMDGDEDFCEVVLDGVFVPDSMVLGEVGDGWHQVTGELAYERYGPERWMSAWGIFMIALDSWSATDSETARAVGRVAAQFRTLREMSLGVARVIDAGGRPAVEAAVVKDIGTRFEQDVVETVRDLLQVEADPSDGSRLQDQLTRSVLSSPIFTLRGGTTEVLRGILAKGLRP